MANIWMPMKLPQSPRLQLHYGTGDGFCNGEIARIDYGKSTASSRNRLWWKIRELIDEGAIPFQFAVWIIDCAGADGCWGQNVRIRFWHNVKDRFVHAKILSNDGFGSVR